ncbi:MAG TPA: tetratricopeptide repeat protein [Acidobacteriota bacterium]|nr:tetratricopeptide repeat protein [Acidobacteriota bacterium]
MAAKSKKNTKDPVSDLEKALKLVYDHKYKEGHKALKNLVDKGELEQRAAASARTFLRICENHLETEEGPADDSAEGLYDWGVALHNGGRREEAMKFFEKALKKAKGEKDHIYYAMAAAQAASKNADKAVEYLSKAADGHPERTYQAGNDPDFREIESNKGFEDLLKEHSQLEPA